MVRENELHLIEGRAPSDTQENEGNEGNEVDALIGII